MEKKFATTAELAKRYRVTRETVRAWVRRGLIPCRRLGRRPILFDVAECDGALKAKTRRQPMMA